MSKNHSNSNFVLSLLQAVPLPPVPLPVHLDERLHLHDRGDRPREVHRGALSNR